MSIRSLLGILLGTSLLSACQPPVQQTQPAASEQTEILAQKATAGVGKQGQRLAGDEGVTRIITGPASALLTVKQRAVLDIQIPHALNLFRGMEGRFPNSHEEFMEKIVEFNKLTLPELPEGAVYRFNTEKGELWVYPEDEAP